MRQAFLCAGCVAAAVLGSLGCSNAPKRSGSTATDDKPKELPTLARQCGRTITEDGLSLSKMDANGDGKPDIWKFFRTVSDRATGKEKKYLERKEIDLNFDGRIDVWRYYTETGDLAKEEFDLDFDCKVDWITYYDGGKVAKKEGDLGFEGRVNVWLFYKNGKLIRREESTKKDGKVDVWKFYDAAGKIERIERDVDGDGKPDRWERPAEPVKPAAKGS